VNKINDPAPAPAQVTCEQLCTTTGRLERLGMRRVNCAPELLDSSALCSLRYQSLRNSIQ